MTGLSDKPSRCHPPGSGTHNVLGSRLPDPDDLAIKTSQHCPHHWYVMDRGWAHGTQWDLFGSSGFRNWAGVRSTPKGGTGQLFGMARLNKMLNWSGKHEAQYEHFDPADETSSYYFGVKPRTRPDSPLGFPNAQNITGYYRATENRLVHSVVIASRVIQGKPRYFYAMVNTGVVEQAVPLAPDKCVKIKCSGQSEMMVAVAVMGRTESIVHEADHGRLGMPRVEWVAPEILDRCGRLVYLMVERDMPIEEAILEVAL